MRFQPSIFRFLSALLAIAANAFFAHAQVGIGTANPNGAAALELQFSNKGFLMTRVSLNNTSDNTTIPSPATSLLVYNTNASMGGGGGTGFYFNAGTTGAPNWTRLQSGAGSGLPWLITGNSGTNPTNNFIGTTDNTPLIFKTNNKQSGKIDPALRSYFWGEDAGVNNSGTGNVGIGHVALRLNFTRSGLVAVGDSVLYFNGVGGTSSAHGIFNTGVGSRALRSNTTGSNNTALGARTMLRNTTGSHNTAAGFDALSLNVSGSNNSAFGSEALENNMASGNTAMGAAALRNNSSGTDNTALGFQALRGNSTGSRNTAVGAFAIANPLLNFDNTAVGYKANESGGERNTALGSFAMEGITAAGPSDNVAVGFKAMQKAGTISNSVAIGNFALNQATGDGNTAIGSTAGSILSTGTNNTFIGNSATTGNSIQATQITNSTAIGYEAKVSVSNNVRIGNGDVTSIGGQVAWTALSDQRAKSDIKANVPGLDFILQLRPVSYQLHANFSAAAAANNGGTLAGKIKPRHVGFLAQEVEQVAKKMQYDFDGIDAPTTPDGTYGIRYGLFVVPLIKAVQEQQIEIAQLLQKAAELKAALERAIQQSNTTQKVVSITTASQQ